ncbi:MAG: hypothetical protein ABSC63_05950 [Candidatus Binataceae bacterium]|jgi:hypothetical protein
MQQTIHGFLPGDRFATFAAEFSHTRSRHQRTSHCRSSVKKFVEELKTIVSNQRFCAPQQLSGNLLVMDFKYSDEAEAFRREFRTWLEANIPPRRDKATTKTSAARSCAPTTTTGTTPSNGIAR